MKQSQVKLLLSLDYELFFGNKSGSVEHCLLRPTRYLLNVVNRYNVKISLFVDAGFLIKLKQYSADFPLLAEQYAAIKKQLQSLSQQGHDIQLHIHPHWQDSYYSSKGWVINSKRYRLHDFCRQEQNEIVTSYKQELESCSEQKIFAFRAGGWCLQPFEDIRQSLENNNIWLDSTLFAEGRCDDPSRWFNFKDMPDKAWWNFKNDPLTEQLDGYFTELPISAVKTSPLFFWKLAFHKQFSSSKFSAFGDGQAIIHDKSYYIQRLSRTTCGPVSLDGSKAGQLDKALKEHKNKADPHAVFNVMGHPKSLTPYSLEKLNTFLQEHHELSSITYQDLHHLRNTAGKN
ncbi:hypothetical protein [Psychromonas aquimarina]|uniref:hypothetical protein n=1 Tax=Psychromonas aquimarina TaxID=444919 RepID=UPI00041455DC|nr:hypothetical protein [Psychromonas aquimarina]